MRIGIVPSLKPSDRGIYQYSITMMHALNERRGDGCKDEFIVFTENGSNIPSVFSTTRGWEIRPLSPPKQISVKKTSLNALRAIVGQGPHRQALRWVRRQLELDVPNPEVVRTNPEMSQ